MSLGLESGTVRLVEYDPTWPRLFADEAERLRAAIGPDLPLELEHMGSTAVPGLIAKPILDLLGGYPPGANVAAYIDALVRAGYTHRGEQGIPGREFFRRGEPRAYHLHLAAHQGAFWKEQLAFRDALRGTSGVRDAYAEIKLALAHQFPRDREAYIEGKGAFVQRIVRESLGRDLKAHWERVYREKAPDQVSWFEPEAQRSLELIRRFAPDSGACILDVGAGASTLVDGLIALGYHRVSVLDLSAAALVQAQHRLGVSADLVEWREADILTASLPAAAYDVWHDRAVFHFLTKPSDRAKYVQQIEHALRPGGVVLMATFAEDGPTTCSGLEVMRYAPVALHAEFGRNFRLLEGSRAVHLTPWGAAQSYTYCALRYMPDGNSDATARHDVS